MQEYELSRRRSWSTLGLRSAPIIKYHIVPQSVLYLYLISDMKNFILFRYKWANLNKMCNIKYHSSPCRGGRNEVIVNKQYIQNDHRWNIHQKIYAHKYDHCYSWWNFAKSKRSITPLTGLYTWAWESQCNDSRCIERFRKTSIINWITFSSIINSQAEYY